MSDPQPSAASHPPQTVDALQREKLEAEVRKLKVDNSLANRLFTTILSVSAVLIAGSQMWMAYQQRAADGVRANRDEDLKQIELHIRQVESGISLSQFAINQRALFLSADVDEQVRAVRLVRALLPRDEALRMLDAYGKLATEAPVLSEVEQGKQALAAAPVTATTPAPAATPPSPPVTRPSPAPVDGIAPGQQPTIYYHVQRSEDRDLANQVAGIVATRRDPAEPAEFPSAGVQVIPHGPSSAEVRYYKTGQAGAAEMLTRRLTAEVLALTGKDVAFKARDISRMFPNLPSDRMEVWFAPSMPPPKQP
jgi:hypothetical protein